MPRPATSLLCLALAPAARANDGRKGAASKKVQPGETVVLADAAGPGVVRRIWLTAPGQVETLRGWVVRMYWDDQDWPSVEAPLQEFFEVLPRVEGRGRHLRAHPTLVGTGTEDLVGSAWGLGRFDHLYQGAPLTAEEDGVWGFYRYHVPDPVYFDRAVRVTLQEMAGGTVAQIRELPPAARPELVRTHRRFEPAEHAAPESDGSTAYWYRSLPSPRWPRLDSYAERTRDLGDR